MAKVDDNVFPKIIADMQTSDPAAPTDRSWKLYSKANGIFARSSNSVVGPFAGGSGSVATDTIWDAAGDLAVGTGADTAARLAIGAAGGAVTRINGAVAWNSGTSFPTAVTGDRYWRTDRGIEYYYDGTRWLTTQEFNLDWSTRVAQTGGGLSATQTSLSNAVIPGTDIYITTIRFVDFVQTTNDGTNKWTLEIFKLSTANATTSLGSVSTGTGPDSINTWTPHDVTVNAVVTAATHPVLRVDATKVASPGALIFSWTVRYRLVG